DGIRDRDVTGVQTCALPISRQGTHAGAARGARTPLRSRVGPSARAGREVPRSPGSKGRGTVGGRTKPAFQLAVSRHPLDGRFGASGAVPGRARNGTP